MAEELVFYTNPQSRGRTVRWMLEEVGQPYRLEVLGFAAEMKAPAYLAINPMGKVPALTHGDAVVTEVAAICAYLADAFPQAHLAPPLTERGDYYRWLFFAAGPLEAAWTNKSFKFELPEGGHRIAGYGSLEMALDAIEGAVSKGPYLAGGAFSAADLVLGSQLSFAMMWGMIDKRPAFVDYVEPLTARPAFKRAAEADNALIPKAQAPA